MHAWTAFCVVWNADHPASITCYFKWYGCNWGINISLFNKAVNKLKTYDIVCREFNTKNKNKQNYYINDTFIINKNVIDYTFQHLEILNNFENENNPKNRFCEFFFSKTISKLNIFSILYNHTTWDNTELGFYHIPSRNYTELNWDKRNIDSIYNENNWQFCFL